MDKPSKAQIRQLMSYLGKRSASKLTPDQRSARAKHAVTKRIEKRKLAQAAA